MKGLILKSAASLLLGISLWSNPWPVLAASGVIEGHIKNATSGGATPSGSPVVLHIVDENDLVERREAQANEQGYYRFEGLETRAGLKYLPITEYQGASYSPRPISLTDQQPQSVDIMVYEASSSDQWIAFERANLLIQAVGTERIEIMEMGALANVGDRTYVGPQIPAAESRPTLKFSVPPAAMGVAPQLGFAPNDFSSFPGGFTISSPVIPGRHQLAFSYSLPFSSDRLEVQKRFDYPTQSFNLYLPDVGLRVEGAQLSAQGQAELGGQKYLLYGAQNVPRGTELRIQLAGLPRPGAGLGEQLSWPLIGLCLVTLLVGLFVTYRRHAFAPRTVSTQANWPQAQDFTDLERMRVLLSLARSQERFERGELSPEEYRDEQQTGRNRLISMRRSQTEAAPREG